MIHTAEVEEKYRQLLSDLGRELVIEDLAPIDENLCVLEMGEDFLVEFDLSDEGWLVVSTVVAEISDSLVDDWKTLLLFANAFWVGTGGATLGLHPQTGSVILCHREPVQILDHLGIMRLFENFVEASQAWKTRIIEGFDKGEALEETGIEAMMHMLE